MKLYVKHKKTSLNTLVSEKIKNSLMNDDNERTSFKKSNKNSLEKKFISTLTKGNRIEANFNNDFDINKILRKNKFVNSIIDRKIVDLNLNKTLKKADYSTIWNNEIKFQDKSKVYKILIKQNYNSFTIINEININKKNNLNSYSIIAKEIDFSLVKNNLKEKNEIYDKKGYIQNELQNNHIKGNGSFILKRFWTMKINLKKRVQFAVKKKN